MKLSPFEQELNADIWSGRVSPEEAREILAREQGSNKLPPLNEVLTELDEAVKTGRITFAEAGEALEDYGQEE